LLFSRSTASFASSVNIRRSKTATSLLISVAAPQLSCSRWEDWSVWHVTIGIQLINFVYSTGNFLIILLYLSDCEVFNCKYVWVYFTRKFFETLSWAD
jgi:hypothetical protein